MILFGLVSLVVIDNYQGKEEEPAKSAMVYLSTEDISWGSVNADENAPQSTTPPTKLLSYQEALALYMGKRIEINEQCYATPNTMTFKNNTKVMIDNSSDTPKILKIGKTTTVKAHGFKIVNLTSTKLPVKMIVDCGPLKGIANITLLK
jgi:hypothetical protein